MTSFIFGRFSEAGPPRRREAAISWQTNAGDCIKSLDTHFAQKRKIPIFHERSHKSSRTPLVPACVLHHPRILSGLPFAGSFALAPVTLNASCSPAAYASSVPPCL